MLRDQGQSWFGIDSFVDKNLLRQTWNCTTRRCLNQSCLQCIQKLSNNQQAFPGQHQNHKCWLFLYINAWYNNTWIIKWTLQWFARVRKNDWCSIIVINQPEKRLSLNCIQVFNVPRILIRKSEKIALQGGHKKLEQIKYQISLFNHIWKME